MIDEKTDLLLSVSLRIVVSQELFEKRNEIHEGDSTVRRKRRCIMCP